MDKDYEKYLLPKRLIFFDLDGTIVPSTSESGRRVAIALSIYAHLQEFAKRNFNFSDMPILNESLCSKWYRENGGPRGLINKVLLETTLSDEIKDSLSFYFAGLFHQRLTKYLPEDLKYDVVPTPCLEFLHSLSGKATLVLISYRYQSQLEFLGALEELGLTAKGLFSSNNAFSVGEAGTSSDGSKARFVGGIWKREIRAQRRLTSNTGKTFPPIIIGDSTRDIHFAVDVGGIFFGVSETGEYSRDTLVAEIKKHESQHSNRSQIFSSLASEDIQRHLIEECEAYKETINTLNK